MENIRQWLSQQHSSWPPQSSLNLLHLMLVSPVPQWFPGLHLQSDSGPHVFSCCPEKDFRNNSLYSLKDTISTPFLKHFRRYFAGVILGARGFFLLCTSLFTLFAALVQLSDKTSGIQDNYGFWLMLSRQKQVNGRLKGLTSLNKNNSANLSGEKRKIKLSDVSIFFENTQKLKGLNQFRPPSHPLACSRLLR